MALDGYAVGVLGKDGVRRIFSGTDTLNALVPSSCGIQPPQAWVSVMLQYNEMLETAQLDAANLGITLVSPFLQALYSLYGGTLPTNLSGNALALPEIMAVLGLLQTFNAGNGMMLDITGSGNAAPPVDTLFTNGVATFPLADGVGVTPTSYTLLTTLSFPGTSPQYGTLDIFEQGDASLDQSSDNGSDIYLHTGDGPTAAQKAAFIGSCAAFGPGTGLVLSYDNATKTATVTVTVADMLPVSGQGIVTPGTGAGNSVVLALEANGVVIDHN